MNGFELQDLMLSDYKVKRIFYGIFPKDKLPTYIDTKPSIVIINTDNSKGEGKHWVAVFIHPRGVCEYFDSFGLPPIDSEILKFVQRNSYHYKYNKKVLQPLFSDTCGYYCYYFASKKARGYSLKKLLSGFRTLRPFFNDKIVTR